MPRSAIRSHGLKVWAIDGGREVQRIGRRFGTVTHANLGVEVRDVALDSALAEHRQLCDLPVGFAFGNQPEYLGLTSR